LVTYGFKEYLMDVNLESHPKPPIINMSPQLQQLILTPLAELKSYRNWFDGESEPVEIIRELAWLVDKNSRINFEIELLKEHYKEIEYNTSTSILNVNMKGKMKTQDLMFQFQIDLPTEYPMKIPSIKIINEFELESHEKIKEDLQSSFKNFFDDWSPFSYLVDLFNAISKKIFEVSVVSCVICHKIDCPTCSLKIAGPEQETCHTDCPYCERSYHKHCWEQTIKSFGKCGFCLKTPPPEMMP
jgi:ubiquitin-protein ligase